MNFALGQFNLISCRIGKKIEEKRKLSQVFIWEKKSLGKLMLKFIYHGIVGFFTPSNTAFQDLLSLWSSKFLAPV